MPAGVPTPPRSETAKKKRFGRGAGAMASKRGWVIPGQSGVVSGANSSLARPKNPGRRGGLPKSEQRYNNGPRRSKGGFNLRRAAKNRLSRSR